jgi:hypothetical protein
MLSHKSQKSAPLTHTNTPTPQRTRITSGGRSVIRSNMPTLVDAAQLEAARLESMRRSSIPPARTETVAARSPEAEINVEWVPESELDSEALFSDYVTALGAFSRVPFVKVRFDELSTLSMDHRMGFLVALIDGASSIQSILDVAAMPQREVLHALVTLRDLGIVGIAEG